MSDTMMRAEERAVQFSRREKRGVVLGLEWSQLVIAGFGALMLVGPTIFGGWPTGFMVGLVLGGPWIVVGLLRINGEPMLMWIKRFVQHVVSSARGQNRYTFKANSPSAPVTRAEARNAARAAAHPRKDGFKPAQPIRMMLPGEAAELLCYEMSCGSSLVYDPLARTASFAAKVSSDAFELLDEDEKEIRVQVWSQLLAGFSAHPGVLRVQTLDRTVVYPSADILEHYDKMVAANAAGPAISALADASYRDLVSGAATHTRHEMYVVVVLSIDRIRKQVKNLGGGIGALMKMAHTEMDAIEADLPMAGARVDQWLNPRELAAVIREAYDPASVEEIGERTGTYAGASVESGGPMAAVKDWDVLQTDTAVHRAYWISEWPRTAVMPGFMSPLVFAGDFVHTVSIVAEPIATDVALKKVEKEQEDVRVSARLNRKLDRMPTLQQEQESRDIQRREQELVAGHGEVRFGGFVTISAKDKEELAAAEARLRHGAAQAHVELRALYGQQHRGFLVGALPLGRGVSKK